jgi:hypothetical protein
MLLLIGLLDSNYELYEEWTVIVHHRGYFRIWTSSCKSVHNRSNISYTHINTRTHTQPGTKRRFLRPCSNGFARSCLLVFLLTSNKTNCSNSVCSHFCSHFCSKKRGNQKKMFARNGKVSKHVCSRFAHKFY